MVMLLIVFVMSMEVYVDSNGSSGDGGDVVIVEIVAIGINCGNCRDCSTRMYDDTVSLEKFG